MDSLPDSGVEYRSLKGAHILIFQVRRPVGHGSCITELGFEPDVSAYTARTFSSVYMLYLFRRYFGRELNVNYM